MANTRIELYLDSSDATLKLNSTSNSDMIWVLKQPIVVPNGYNTLLKIRNMYLPITFYVVNSSNNLLVVGSTTYTIPVGNHTATTLKSALTSLLTGYTITFSTLTNKLTFTKASGDFTISSASTCLKILGFVPGTSYTSTSSILSSVFPIDLSGDNTIFIDVPNLKTPNILNGNSTSIIKSLLVTVPYGSILYYENQVDNGAIIQEDSISFIHVRILGEDSSTLLDFQNNDWQITLDFSFVLKEEQPTLTENFRDVYKNYVSQLVKNKNE